MQGRSGLLALITGAALTACGGGAPAGPPAGIPSPSPSAAESLADAVRIDAAVDVALAGDEFAAVDEEPAPVAVGDVVRTDDAGFAEVAYYDGSVTRLDVDTSLEIVALSDAPEAAEIRTRMDLGRTWNRVTDDPDRDFTIETGVATAAVRGTAFIIDCPDEDTCTFTVLEGTIEVTPTGGDPILLTAPAALEVTAAGDTSDAEVAVVADDDWLTRNGDLDDDAGFDALPEPAPEPVLAGLEDLAGDWTATPSDLRLGSEGGRFSGSSGTLDGGVITVSYTSGEPSVSAAFHGPVFISCADGACDIVDSDGALATLGGTVEAPGLEVATACPETHPAGAGEIRELSRDRFVFTTLRGAYASEDCGQHVWYLYEVTLVR